MTRSSSRRPASRLDAVVLEGDDLVAVRGEDLHPVVADVAGVVPQYWLITIPVVGRPEGQQVALLARVRVEGVLVAGGQVAHVTRPAWPFVESVHTIELSVKARSPTVRSSSRTSLASVRDTDHRW